MAKIIHKVDESGQFNIHNEDIDLPKLSRNDQKIILKQIKESDSSVNAVSILKVKFNYSVTNADKNAQRIESFKNFFTEILINSPNITKLILGDSENNLPLRLEQLQALAEIIGQSAYITELDIFCGFTCSEYAETLANMINENNSLTSFTTNCNDEKVRQAAKTKESLTLIIKNKPELPPGFYSSGNQNLLFAIAGQEPKITLKDLSQIMGDDSGSTPQSP